MSNRLPFQPGARVLLLAKFAALGSRGTVVRRYGRYVALRMDGHDAALLYGIEAVVELEEPPPHYEKPPPRFGAANGTDRSREAGEDRER